MTLYTSKVVAQWLGLTERRVRQLRDEGVIEERRPGLYDLRSTVLRYIHYLRKGSGTNLNDERAMLTRAKREAAERENQLRQGELIEVSQIEKALSDMLLNFRSRLLCMPAKLSPSLATMGGQQGKIFDLLKKSIEESMEELSDWHSITKQKGEEDDSTAE